MLAWNTLVLVWHGNGLVPALTRGYAGSDLIILQHDEAVSRSRLVLPLQAIARVIGKAGQDKTPAEALRDYCTADRKGCPLLGVLAVPAAA